MILTRNAELAERFRLLRAHGWSRNLKHPPAVVEDLDPRYTFLNWGFNVRPTELQAGFGLVQLERSDGFQEFRDQNARLAIERLRRHSEVLSLMSVSDGGRCSWFALPILVSEAAGFTRDELTAFLEANGVETRPVVTGNLARHPAISNFASSMSVGDLPGADQVHVQGLYVGLHPEDSVVGLNRLFDLIDEFVVNH